MIENSLFVIAEEAKKYGIRSCLCYEVSDRDGEEKCNQAIRENSKFIQYAKEDQTGLLMGMMGLHAAWGEVPAMLFENNAKIAARHFGQKLGILEKSAAADLIILDYRPLTPMGECNYNGHILFGMNGRMVTVTIANGKILMKNRELIGIDEERILSDCREEAEKLWNSING